MMECLSIFVLMIDTGDLPFPAGKISRIEIHHLAFVTAHGRDFFLYHIAYVNPVIWLIGREVINVPHTVRRNPVN